uniref:Protein bm5863 isoform d n=1 Tax=Ixodes ricinus TaxID=34613 RepID=A0A147BNX9_IXORI
MSRNVPMQSASFLSSLAISSSYSSAFSLLALRYFVLSLSSLMPWLYSSLSLRIFSSALMYCVAAKMLSNLVLSVCPSDSGQLESVWWQKITFSKMARGTPKSSTTVALMSQHLEVAVVLLPSWSRWTMFASTVLKVVLFLFCFSRKSRFTTYGSPLTS